MGGLLSFGIGFENWYFPTQTVSLSRWKFEETRSFSLVAAVMGTGEATTASSSARAINEPGMVPYGRAYYESLEPSVGGSRRSATIIVPELLKWVQPRSVIDVGCGVGSWLAAFQEVGIDDVLGVDLDNVDRDLLLIPPHQFQPFDLRQPLSMDREFDLALCLEVVGHLPASLAEQTVKSLVALSPLILFSAPIPLQGGPNQINEQWPDYWADHFRRHGYVVIDCLRSAIWNNPDVKWWFAQNLLLYVRAADLAKYPRLQDAQKQTITQQLSLVHPRLHLECASLDRFSLKKVLRALPRLITNSMGRRLSSG
ncbi:MAG TPA: methyltransferase domain-containing protein [Chthoniobacterales bacterium]